VPSTRELLLDAAADAAVGVGWASARMADVARAAGVSRQTLYYEFRSKDALGEALAMREAERYMAGADAALTGSEGSPAEAVAAGARYTLTAAAENPLLKAVLTDDSGSLLPYLTTRAEAILAAARDHLTEHVRERWPGLDGDDVVRAADMVNRLTLSHLVLPGGRPNEVADDIAHLVDRLLPVPSHRRPERPRA
jgi:AcrR family transcriptional regulator